VRTDATTWPIAQTARCTFAVAVTLYPADDAVRVIGPHVCWPGSATHIHVGSPTILILLCQILLCDQWTDEALIAFLDQTFTLKYGTSTGAGALSCVINDQGIPSLAEEDGHDQQR
jgi:hypothetical protein